MNKETLRAKIKEWLAENEIDAGIHIQWYETLNDKPDYVTIHNGVGGLNKKQRWLNKITLRYQAYHRMFINKNPGWYIRYAIARTDKNFLPPTPENFRQFVEQLLEMSTVDKGE